MTKIVARNAPMELCEDPMNLHRIDRVALAATTKIGARHIEAEIMSEDLRNPEVDCWFYLEVVYLETKNKGAFSGYAKDRILTDGKRYFLIRRNLGKSSFVLNERSKAELDRAIRDFVTNL